MSFKIKKIADESTIEIISMNIDKDNSILIFQDNELSLLNLEDFKEMVLGTVKDNSVPNSIAKPATYKLVE